MGFQNLNQNRGKWSDKVAVLEVAKQGTIILELLSDLFSIRNLFSVWRRREESEVLAKLQSNLWVCYLSIIIVIQELSTQWNPTL